jgi:hypothetical protein
MYRRSKFVEVLHEIRREMSAEADFDVDIFAEMVRSGSTSVPDERRKSITAEPSNEAEELEPLVERFDG